MSSDRFQFLEFGDDEGPAEGAASPEAPPTNTGLSPVPLRDAAGLPLAQVVVEDPRGYGAMLRAVREEEHAPRTRSGSEDNRLRVTEVIGGRGQAAGEFNFPAGLAVDADGILFVADSYNHRVQRITPQGGVSVLGTRGGGRGQFLSPQAVATDAQRAFYIVEQGNARVQKFSAQGVLELVFGKSGSGRGELRGPTGIAVAPGTGDIYVADTGNRRVVRFDSGGRFLTMVGTGGRSAPLISPQAVAVSDSDFLYVADSGRVALFDPMGRALPTLSGLTFHAPRAVALAPGGPLYVADTLPDARGGLESVGRVQSVELRGMVGETLSVPKTLALTRPVGLAVTGGGDVYVSDAYAHRILRFTRQQRV